MKKVSKKVDGGVGNVFKGIANLAGRETSTQAAARQAEAAKQQQRQAEAAKAAKQPQKSEAPLSYKEMINNMKKNKIENLQKGTTLRHALETNNAMTALPGEYVKAKTNFDAAKGFVDKYKKAVDIISKQKINPIDKITKIHKFNTHLTERLREINGGGFLKGVKNLFGRERNQQINAFLTCFLEGKSNMQYEYSKLSNSSKLIIARFFKLYEPERMNGCLRNRKEELIMNGYNRYYRRMQKKYEREEE